MDFGQESGRSAVAEQLIWDYRQAELGDDERALCDYAVGLTLHPQQMGQEDIDGLRRVGWSDEQITIAAQVIGYFNYINRVADGLGVDAEPWMELSREDWLSRKGTDYSAL